MPEPDTFQMRGFDPRQFLVAVDGLVVQKTGGWWGDHCGPCHGFPFGCGKYLDNLFDEEYSNSRGYPMTDRTFGAAFHFGF